MTPVAIGRLESFITDSQRQLLGGYPEHGTAGGEKVDERTGQTNIPYIFAGGDVVNGADLVVTAIADGKRAATWLHTYLTNLDAFQG